MTYKIIGDSCLDSDRRTEKGPEVSDGTADIAGGGCTGGR